jgi:hypothetical protein
MNIDDINLNETITDHINVKNTQQQCLYLFNYLFTYCDKNSNNNNVEDCRSILTKTLKCDIYEDLSKYRFETEITKKHDLSTFPSMETLRFGVRSIGVEKTYADYE